MDETCGDLDDYNEKKYANRCESCDFVVNATKRYVALQQLKKHRESCSNSKKKQTGGKNSQCDLCEFKDNESMSMRRHMRDQHDIFTGSTSPPPKRKKKVSIDGVESMDVEEEEVHDLSLKLEEMEVDSITNETKKKESDLMDEKVMEKQRRIEESEMLLKNEKDKLESKKRIAEKEKLKRFKTIHEKKKQVLKSQIKKTNIVQVY